MRFESTAVVDESSTGDIECGRHAAVLFRFRTTRIKLKHATVRVARGLDVVGFDIEWAVEIFDHDTSGIVKHLTEEFGPTTKRLRLRRERYGRGRSQDLLSKVGRQIRELDRTRSGGGDDLRIEQITSILLFARGIRDVEQDESGHVEIVLGGEEIQLRLDGPMSSVSATNGLQIAIGGTNHHRAGGGDQAIRKRDGVPSHFDQHFDDARVLPGNDGIPAKVHDPFQLTGQGDGRQVTIPGTP